MKAASKYILKYFVVGVVTCLSLLFLSCPVKAATSDNFAGHWYVWEENVNVSGNQWISYQNVLIVTNDPLAMGQIQVNNTTSGPSNFVQTLDFSGTYTFYSHRFEQPFTVQNGLMPVATSNGRAFTTYTPIQSSNNIEIVELSSSQINSLISSIQASGSYDDTDLLNQLAIINGVLNNIDTSTSATASSIAALNTTATNILTALNSLDNAIDTISWSNPGASISIGSDPYDYQNFSSVPLAANYNVSANTPLWIRLTSSYFNSTERLFYLEMPYYNNAQDFSGMKFNVEFYYRASRANDYIIKSPNSLEYHWWNGKLFLYFNTATFGNNDVFIKITSNKGMAMTRSAWTCKYLDSSDIEYWQLKSFMLQAASQQSDTSSIDQENNNLSNQVDDYVQQEDQLIGGFDTAMTNPAVIPTSNPDSNLGSWGSNFISSLSLFSVLVGNVVGTSLTQWGNPIYLLLNFSLVFGFALLIIGKRG